MSGRVGLEVSVARWGEVGTPVLVFPTAGGDAEEIERFRMIERLAPLLAEGRIKVYSVDSIPGAAWLHDRGDVEYRSWLQNRYDGVIHDEVVPFIRDDCGDPSIEIVTAGASLGAFHAVTSVVRHPDVFRLAIGLSGTYDFEHWLDGRFTEEFYYASPVHFLPGLDDPDHLALLGTRSIRLVSGEGPHESPTQAYTMARVLGDRGVPNRVDLWGPDFDHEWEAWRTQLPAYLAGLA